LSERLKDHVLLLRRNADAGVLDREPDPRFIGIGNLRDEHLQMHMSLERELHGVRNQILEHLTQPL
jgi:hypothetical protein